MILVSAHLDGRREEVRSIRFGLRQTAAQCFKMTVIWPSSPPHGLHSVCPCLPWVLSGITVRTNIKRAWQRRTAAFISWGTAREANDINFEGTHTQNEKECGCGNPTCGRSTRFMRPARAGRRTPSTSRNTTLPRSSQFQVSNQCFAGFALLAAQRQELYECVRASLFSIIF